MLEVKVRLDFIEGFFLEEYLIGGFWVLLGELRLLG